MFVNSAKLFVESSRRAFSPTTSRTTRPTKHFTRTTGEGQFMKIKKSLRTKRLDNDYGKRQIHKDVSQRLKGVRIKMGFAKICGVVY